MTKRVLCTLLAASVTVLTLVSCNSSSSGSSSASSSDSSSAASSASAEDSEASGDEESSSDAAYTPNFDEEPYTVHFEYWVSKEGSGQQGVNDALNELALKELNMNVELMPHTVGTWTTTMSMILAANEPLDLFLCGSGTFGTYIDSGYVLNWADYEEYLPDVFETLGDDVYAGYVGDFLIGFSQMKERGYQMGLVARKDIMDELGLTEDDFSITTQDTSTYQQLTDLFAKVKEAHPSMVVVGGTSNMFSLAADLADNLGNNFGMLENFGQTTTITNYFESDLCKDLAMYSRDWFQKGYFSADAATNLDSGETLLRAGNLFSYFTNIKPNTNVEKFTQTGYEVYVIPAAETTFTSSMSVNACVYSLANASENPVKAAIFYNWATASGDFNDLINWGVKDVDWVETEDGLAAYPEGIDASNNGYHNDYGFAYPNQFAGHPWVGNSPDIWEQYKVYNAGLLRSKAFGFTFDPIPVTDYVAACTAVYDQYAKDIGFGAVDPEAALAEMNATLYSSGLQEIMDEKQAQLDAWLESNQE